MTYIFEAHVPNFVDLDKNPEPVAFENKDELLELFDVKKFSREKGFNHFARAGEHLMAIFDDGKRWFVVGRLSSHDGLDLSDWRESVDLKYASEG